MPSQGLDQDGLRTEDELWEHMLKNCIGLLVHWMVGDARRRGLNPWPWVVATLLGGSLVLLVYLVRRTEERPLRD